MPEGSPDASGRTVWSRLSLKAERDEVRTRLWPLPVMALAVALVVGVLLPRLDAAIDDDLPAAVTDYLFGGGAGAARTVLNAIATSLISVTSLTFSLTVVTLQLASSQYSPRLLRTFTRDRFVHVTLALFLGSFVYALTVLRTVRTAEGGQDPFVPQISVTFSFLLALTSVLGLVLFLAHLAREIRVETILRNVHDEATATLRRVLEPRDRSALPLHTVDLRPSPPQGVPSSPVLAPESGFLVAADLAPLERVAQEADLVVVIVARVGDALVQGTPIGTAWQRSTDRTDGLDGVEEAIGQALETRFERTGREDVAFGLRQLVDVVVRALSPGVNDPTTAVHGLNHAAALLCELLDRRLAPQVRHDAAGVVRVHLNQWSFAELLELAVCQPRNYGASDPYVAGALLELLRAVAWVARTPAEREAIGTQLSEIRRQLAATDVDAAHRSVLDELEGEVRSALTGG